MRDHAGAILCVRPSPHPDRLLTAAKDNSLRLWDFRQLGTVQVGGEVVVQNRDHLLTGLFKMLLPGW